MMAGSPGSASTWPTSCAPRWPERPGPTLEEPPRPPRRFYGRRHGKPLRAGRAALFHSRLPQLALDPDRGGPAPIDPRRLFDPPAAEAWLEIGFGGGEHLAAQAAAHPAVGFIGCEPFVTGAARLIAHLEASSAGNVRLFLDDARLLLPRLGEASLGRVFLLFPDPWPKKRHHKRRFVSRETVAELARVLADDGLLRFASDHPGYVRWTLEHLAAEPALAWTARRPADWREPPADWVGTRYEAKARAAGRPCSFLEFRRRRRQPSTNP
jgi:tRNA (guanine-N7-)-methyltransferase